MVARIRLVNLTPEELQLTGAEPIGAEARAKQYTDDQLAQLPPPALPTLAELGGEPQGAESRARLYTDQKFSEVPPPIAPTLTELGGEPAGAEDRAKQYTAQEVAALVSRIRALERRHATRINCGNGPIYYGSDGLWQADIYASSSTVANISASFPTLPPASGYSDPFVLNFMRFASSFNYTIPIANGLHSVELLFVEPYFNNVGEKIFNVFIQGQQVLTNFDILAHAKKMQAVSRVFSNIVVSDNRLIISFTSVRDQASISGIIIRHGS